MPLPPPLARADGTRIVPSPPNVPPIAESTDPLTGLSGSAASSSLARAFAAASGSRFVDVSSGTSKLSAPEGLSPDSWGGRINRDLTVGFRGGLLRRGRRAGRPATGWIAAWPQRSAPAAAEVAASKSAVGVDAARCISVFVTLASGNENPRARFDGTGGTLLLPLRAAALAPIRHSRPHNATRPKRAPKPYPAPIPSRNRR